MPETALRVRHAQLTQDVVMEALALVIIDRGVADFSVQDVADRANVSLRTVYRHFPTREALLAALVAWVETRVVALGGMAFPEHPDQVVPMLRRKFDALDQMAPFVVAALKLDTAKLAHAQQSSRSGRAMRSALAEITTHLRPDVADVVIALIRQVGSSRMWLTLREDEGIEGVRSADVAAWVVDTLIKELRAGRGPAAEAS